MSEQVRRYKNLVALGIDAVKATDYDALHAEAEALRADTATIRADRDAFGQNAVSLRSQVEALRADNEKWQRSHRDIYEPALRDAHAYIQELRTDLESARGLLRDIYMTCNLREMPSEYAIRDISNQIEALLTATPAPEVRAEQGERQEASQDVRALVEAMSFACKALCHATSSDGSGHADIALSVLRMAGVDADERERLVDGWKASCQWRIDKAHRQEHPQ